MLRVHLFKLEYFALKINHLKINHLKINHLKMNHLKMNHLKINHLSCQKALLLKQASLVSCYLLLSPLSKFEQKTNFSTFPLRDGVRD